jgi:hypothetical protein
VIGNKKDMIINMHLETTYLYPILILSKNFLVIVILLIVIVSNEC